MAAEKHFTAAPYDFEGEGFTQLGLQAALDRVHAKWGGRAIKSEQVSPALSLGAGTTMLGTEAGLVLFKRNKEEDERARRVVIEDDGVDGRARKYFADVEIGRYFTKKHTEPTTGKHIVEGDGLMGLLGNVAALVQAELGDVPECLYREAVEKRIPSIRAQLGKAKGDTRDSTMIVFPPTSQAVAFQGFGNNQGAWYFVLVNIYAEEEHPRKFKPAPRRQRNATVELSAQQTPPSDSGLFDGGSGDAGSTPR